LFAANLAQQPIAEVLRWVLRQDLEPAGLTLEDHDAQVANDVLVGIAKTDARERSSIFSATAGVLAAYNADATRRAATTTNFDADRFAGSHDTIYVTAPAHQQALCAPLVVGLLEQIRHATYTHAATNPGRPPVFLCLDEVANIAPIHDLPALVSEAGGQGLHVMACLQDLSQARERWGQDAADGFLSLFQTKLILTGIADPHTLEALSLALGEYDRHLVPHTLGRTRTEGLFPPPGTASETVTYHTQRHRTLPPGDIARLPNGHGLLLRGTHWGLLRLTPWYRTEPWSTVAGVLQAVTCQFDGAATSNVRWTTLTEHAG
jgi:type IV secretion system protein VirD4